MQTPWSQGCAKERIIGTSLLVALALGVGKAQAQARTVDVEMLRPTFSAGGPPGVDSPVVAGRGAVRTGLLTQYERDPVILYQFGEEYGVVVKNRQSFVYGFAWDVHDRVTLRAVMPVAFQAGFDNAVADQSWNGLGLGDLSLGAKGMLAQAGPVTIGGRLDMYLPTGTNEAWLGDPGFRFQPGLTALVEVWRLGLLADLSYVGRTTEQPSRQDFAVESTLDINAGVRMDIWPERVAVDVGYLSKGGVSHLGQGGGENASELIGGLMLHRKDGSGQIDLGVGKGLAQGVGTTAFRGYAAYTFIFPPKARPEPEPVVKVIEEPPPPPEPIIVEPEIEEPPEPEWEPEEEAKVVRDQIVIRKPIQFEFAKDVILPESLDTLEAVATILNEHAEIEHLVIEGHASVEGSYEYNYDLSNLRARAIWKELMAQGVHPDRISYRGMGEVVPKDKGEDEESLASNRRVEFHIVDWVEADEDWPEYPATYRLPWSGDMVDTVQPLRPPEPTEPEDKEEVEEALKDLIDPTQFLEDEDEEDEL